MLVFYGFLVYRDLTHQHLPGLGPPGDGSLGPLLDPRLSRLQFGHRIIKEPELDLKVRHLEWQENDHQEIP